jgi:hypothetical protein
MTAQHLDPDSWSRFAHADFGLDPYLKEWFTRPRVFKSATAYLKFHLSRVSKVHERSKPITDIEFLNMWSFLDVSLFAELERSTLGQYLTSNLCSLADFIRYRHEEETETEDFSNRNFSLVMERYFNEIIVPAVSALYP